MMTMTKVLDRGNESSIAQDIVESIDEAGYSVEEAIPGLIGAIILLAEKSRWREACLDEANDLLVDAEFE